ncbi:MAG: prepilin-type N-terminal cleavage/methylation domain-containing protein [Planctomycetes bacterium]|nr:prepilin-type N-terminal cleavage/methylation domain-containing protein [Planctomycetota bacterium]
MANLNIKTFRRTAAFTLIEILVTVVILAIAALIAVPMMGSAADIQVRSAAHRLAADLEYAKNMAITYQRPFAVVFDTSAGNTNGYQIPNESHPVSGQDFDVRFAKERNLSRVKITRLTLEPGTSPTTVTFDYMGTPKIGEDSLNKGQITLTADGFSLVVNIEPLTGYVTIDTIE